MQYLGTPERLVQRSHDWTETSPSVAVLEAIAAVEGVSPTDLHTDHNITLYDSVDLEALDALLTHDSEVTVSFTVDDYRVHISGELLTISSTSIPPE